VQRQDFSLKRGAQEGEFLPQERGAGGEISLLKYRYRREDFSLKGGCSRGDSSPKIGVQDEEIRFSNVRFSKLCGFIPNFETAVIIITPLPTPPPTPKKCNLGIRTAIRIIAYLGVNFLVKIYLDLIRPGLTKLLKKTKMQTVQPKFCCVRRCA